MILSFSSEKEAVLFLSDLKFNYLDYNLLRVMVEPCSDKITVAGKITDANFHKCIAAAKAIEAKGGV